LRQPMRVIRSYAPVEDRIGRYFSTVTYDGVTGPIFCRCVGPFRLYPIVSATSIVRFAYKLILLSTYGRYIAPSK
jgi:hypothetical protein